MATNTEVLRAIPLFAGMTDRFAVSRYRQVVGPIEMPEGI